MNTIFSIHPYKKNGIWQFDDAERGLKGEAFVSGADDILDLITEDVPDAHKGVTLIVSAEPFPDFDYAFEWERPGSSGNWYYSQVFDRSGWLCASLLKYFTEAPKNIYVKVVPKADNREQSEWEKASDDARNDWATESQNSGYFPE